MRKVISRLRAACLTAVRRAPAGALSGFGRWMCGAARPGAASPAHRPASSSGSNGGGLIAGLVWFVLLFPWFLCRRVCGDRARGMETVPGLESSRSQHSAHRSGRAENGADRRGPTGALGVAQSRENLRERNVPESSMVRCSRKASALVGMATTRAGRGRGGS